jgi:hypothetical protein
LDRLPLEKLRCDCGNNIRMFNKLTYVKCYRCGCIWDKIHDRWIKATTYEPTPTDMTFADVVVKIGRNK